MKKPGQVALMSFPQVDLMPGQRRPVLLIAPVPGPIIIVSALVAVGLLVSGAFYFRRMEKTFADVV